MSNEFQAAKGVVSLEADPKNDAVLGKLEGDVQRTGKAIAASAQQAGSALGKVGDGGADAADKVDRTSTKLIGSIQRTTAAMEAGSRSSSAYYEAIAKQRGIDPNVLKPYIDQLRQAEEAQKSNASSVGGGAHAMGEFSFATAGARRELIVLAHEMSQGNYSRFGGSLLVIAERTNAASLLFSGAAITAGVLAASVGVVALAAAKGAAELRGFENSLTLTGNVLGQTSSGFAQLRTEIGAIATQGKAAEALDAIAASGLRASGNMRGIAEAAILLEKATGQEIGKTVEQFKELERAPAEAVAKLNEQYNFLSASVYKQIKALEDQGDRVRAANLAEDAYASALTQRAQTVLQNAGIMEKAWRGVVKGAKEAWDAMLGIGRQVTTGEQIQILQQQLESLRDRNKNIGIGDANGDTKHTRELKEQVDYLNQLEKESRRLAAADADRARIAERAIQIAQHQGDYLTKAQQQAKALSDAEAQGQRDIADGLITQEQLRTRLYNIRLQYQQTAGNDEIARMKAIATDAAQQIELLQKKMQSGDLSAPTQLTEAQKKVNEIEEKLKLTLDKTTRAHLDQALAAAKNAVAQQTLLQYVTKQESAWEKSVHTLDEQVAASDQLAESYRQQAIEQLNVAANFGKSDIAIKQALLSQINLKLAEEDSYDPRFVASLYNQKAALEQLIPALQGVAQKQEALNLLHLGQANEADRQLLEYELSVVGQVADVRTLLIEKRKIELDYAKKIADVDLKNLKPEDAAADKAKLEAEKVLAISNATSRAIVDQWQRASDEISNALTDAFVQAFTKGGSLGKNLAQALKTEFANLVLRPTIQAIVSSTGIPQLLGQAAAGSSGAGGNLFSAGGSLVNAGTVGYQYLTGSMSGANAAGTLYANGAGGGIDTLLATNGAYGTVAGSAVGAGVTGTGISSVIGAGGAQTGIAFGAVDTAAVGAGTVAEGGGLLAGGASGALAAIPVAGWVALAAIAAYEIFGSSGHGPKTESGFGPGVDHRGDPQASQQISDAIATMLKTAGAAIGADISQQVGVFIGQDPNGTALTQLQIKSANYDRGAVSGGVENVGRSQADLQNAIQLSGLQDVFTEMKAAIDKNGLTGSIDDFVKSIDPLHASLQELQTDFQKVSDFGGLSQVLGTLGETFAKLKGLSVDAAEALVQASGGIQNLATNLQTYAQNFLTAEEQRQTVVADVTKKLIAAGVEVTADQLANMGRQAFRALVDSFDVTTAEGAKAVAALYSVSGEFASITQSASDAASSMSNVASIMQPVADDIANAAKAQADMVAKSKLDAIAFANQQQTSYLIGQDKIRQYLKDLQHQLYEITDPAKAVAMDRTDTLNSHTSRDEQSLQLRVYAEQDLAALQKSVDAQVAIYQPKVDAALAEAETLAKFASQLGTSSLGGLSLSAQYLQTREDLRKATADTIQELTGRFLTASQGVSASRLEYLTSVAFAREQVLGVKQQELTQARYYEDTINLMEEQVRAMRDLLPPIDDMTFAILKMRDAIVSGYFGKIPGYASGGYFGGGLALVGERGPELISSGPAQIVNALDTRRLLSAVGGLSLVGEIAAMRSDMRASLNAIAIHTLRTAAATQKTQRQILAVMKGAQAFTTEAA